MFGHATPKENRLAASVNSVSLENEERLGRSLHAVRDSSGGSKQVAPIDADEPDGTVSRSKVHPAHESAETVTVPVVVVAQRDGVNTNVAKTPNQLTVQTPPESARGRHHGQVFLRMRHTFRDPATEPAAIRALFDRHSSRLHTCDAQTIVNKRRG